MALRTKSRDREQQRLRRHRRVRRKVTGTPERPRLVIHRSLRNIQGHLADDLGGSVLLGVSTLAPDVRAQGGTKRERAKAAGKLLADGGARVIQIEPIPGSPGRWCGPFVDDKVDPDRCLDYWWYNTGKESLAVDITRKPGQDLLLARRAGEVRLPVCLPDPGVGEGLLAVQVMPAGGDREALREAAAGVPAG